MKLRDGLKLTMVDDGYIIYDSERERIIALNITSSFILEMLLEDRNMEEIVQEYARAFDVDVETARRDYTDFISMMKREGLIED